MAFPRFRFVALINVYLVIKNSVISSMLKKSAVAKLLVGIAATSVLGVAPANAVETSAAGVGIIGKNEWLFYGNEIMETDDAALANVSIDLIRRFNKVLASNGITMAVVMVPIKMRIYAEHLPDDLKVNAFMTGNYERIEGALREGQVNVININSAFLKSPLRTSDTPLFFRLDTHWSSTGALLGAETIKTEVAANPVLKKALDATTVEAYKMIVSPRKRASKSRDILQLLPANSPANAYAIEHFYQVNVSRTQPPKEDLLGNRLPVGVALVGSSYSHDWSGFADDLRYVLQRDILSVAVGADQGSWVGMESYLRDDAFQTNAPKLLIWEMPERDMRAPPDYKFRDVRYKIDGTEWLLRASAWIQTKCTPSNINSKLLATGIAKNLKDGDVSSVSTQESDFIEIGFNPPIEKLDYLQARFISAGSKTIVLEATGQGVSTRKFTLNAPGDDSEHALKTPLPSNGKGYSKVRIFPGKTTKFTFQNLQTCRQPEGINF
jgi:alginate O-acetyltransferase complex protein AlgJ